MFVFEEIGNGQPVLVITAPPVFQFVVGADHKDAFAEFAVQRKRKFRNAVLICRERKFLLEQRFVEKVFHGNRRISLDSGSCVKTQFRVDRSFGGDEMIGGGGPQFPFDGFRFKRSGGAAFFQLERINPDGSAF